MPIIDLTQGQKTMSRYDVVGQWSKIIEHFVVHVALLDEEKLFLEQGDKVNIIHMAPPLKREDEKTVDIGGCIPLTNEEKKQIEIWIEKVADELPNSRRDQYVIHPPWKDEEDPVTHIRRYRRYSCAGFVLDSHRQININLLDIREESLPLVDRQTIISAYPAAREYPDILIDWGLKGNGPWKVVLAGYILHSLKRPSDEIRSAPYQAKKGDEKF